MMAGALVDVGKQRERRLMIRIEHQRLLQQSGRSRQVAVAMRAKRIAKQKSRIFPVPFPLLFGPALLEYLLAAQLAVLLRHQPSNSIVSNISRSSGPAIVPRRTAIHAKDASRPAPLPAYHGLRSEGKLTRHPAHN